MQLKPVEKESLSQQLYIQLRQALMDGALSPGDRLTLTSIAEQFGTSTTPVREAVLRLVSERALEMRAATSFSVPKINVDELTEIQLIRIELEGLAAERAASIITTKEVEKLKKIQEEFIAAASSDPGQASILNRGFHFEILKIANLPLVEGIVENMWVLMGPFLRVFHDQTPKRQLSASEHRHQYLLEALQRRDPKAALKAMQDDIRWGADLFRKMKFK